MKTPQIWIEHNGGGKQIAGLCTQVYLLREDGEGNEERIDISNVVRGVDLRLRVDEVITAKLDCFVTGVKTRAEVEDVVVQTFKPRRGFWRRMRDITTFGADSRQYV